MLIKTQAVKTEVHLWSGGKYFTKDARVDDTYIHFTDQYGNKQKIRLDNVKVPTLASCVRDFK